MFKMFVFYCHVIEKIVNLKISMPFNLDKNAYMYKLAPSKAYICFFKNIYSAHGI